MFEKFEVVENKFCIYFPNQSILLKDIFTKIENSKKVKREEVDRRVKEDSPKFSEKFSDQPEAVDICERVSFS